MKIGQLATAGMLMLTSFFPTRAQDEIAVDIEDNENNSRNLQEYENNFDLAYEGDNSYDAAFGRRLSIFASDDRVEYDPLKYQRGVGLLSEHNNRRVNHCTATLVGRDLILTAAKCLYRDVKDSTGNVLSRKLVPNWKSNVMFQFGYTDGHPGEHNSRLQKVFVPKEFKNASPSWPQHNFAIVQLKKALGDITGFMNIKPRRVKSYDQQKVSLVSFMYKGNTTASADYCCEIIGHNAGRVKHTCDTSYGANGAPLYVQRRGNKPGTYRYSLVAMHNEAGAEFNLASATLPITKLFNFAKNHLLSNPEYMVGAKKLESTGNVHSQCSNTASPTTSSPTRPTKPTRPTTGKPTTAGGEVPTSSKPTAQPSPVHTHRPTLEPTAPVPRPPTTGGNEVTNSPTSWPTKFYTNSPTRPTKFPSSFSPTNKPTLKAG